MQIQIITIHFLKTVSSFEKMEAKGMGVHFLNAQGGLWINPPTYPEKNRPQKKDIVNSGQFVHVQTAHLPWETQVADKAWLEADWGLITLDSLFMSLEERNGLNWEIQVHKRAIPFLLHITVSWFACRK